eukprot:scaffold15327_cov16-Prasinocladus_malaysianus.AAC.1
MTAKDVAKQMITVYICGYVVPTAETCMTSGTGFRVPKLKDTVIRQSFGCRLMLLAIPAACG